MLDSKFLKLKHHFGISKPEDWCDVHPEWIAAQEGIGPVTLEHLRIYLAARDLTLKNDRTPQYWREHLSAVKIGHQLGYDEGDTAVVTPFCILLDSGEQAPFTFLGMKSDADSEHRPFIVQTEWRCLGRHPDSLGDYSLDGFVGHCHVERKSVEDCQGTILGFKDGRRERFESELSNLSKIESGLVVVEGTLAAVVNGVASWGKKTRQQNAKTLLRSILAFNQDYSVPWLFCDSRRLAEVATFRFLERYWKKNAKEQKEIEGLVASL